ncbi:MAG: hypothetical protein QXG98_03725 [Candidatus Micrarchaeia archaeon]
MKLQSAHNHREHLPATRTFDIIARNEHAHASGLTAFGRSRRSFLVKAALLSLGVTFGLSVGGLARAADGQPANAAKAANAQEVDNEFGFVKGKTTLQEAIKTLEEKGVTNIVIGGRIPGLQDEQQPYLLLLADGFVYGLGFHMGYYDGVNKIVLAGISPLSNPTHFTVVITKEFSFFVTAENLLAEYNGRAYPVLSMVGWENDKPKVHGTFFDLSKIIKEEGGFKEPRLIYNVEEGFVALIAKDNNGNYWKNVYGWDAKTFEPIGRAPAEKILKTH